MDLRRRGLGRADLARIQDVALHNAAGPKAVVLHDAPIAAPLDILLSPGLPQTHDAESPAGESGHGNGVGLHDTGLQPCPRNIVRQYQILIEPYPDQYRAFRGRIREVGLHLIIFDGLVRFGGKS
jgi:hypothetical protein